MTGPRKLLLVDDSPIALMMVQTVLRGSGYQLREAHDGAQALELVHTDLPDLIVMDFAMPNMDGLSALRALKADAKTRKIPVIMLTAAGAAEEIERCFQAGCDAYVTKPINAGELKSQIEALFEQTVDQDPSYVDKRAYQKMFLDVDGPIASQMVDALDAMTTRDHSQHHEAGLLCHRLRGDARTVGFTVLGDLTGIIEERLRDLARGGVLDEMTLAELRRIGHEVKRRMVAGEAACNEPLADELLCFVPEPSQD